MATDRDVEVPDPEHPRIVADERFGGEPRIVGRRITVLDVYEQVEEGAGEMTPEEFRRRFDSTLLTCITPSRTITPTQRRWSDIGTNANAPPTPSENGSSETGHQVSIRRDDSGRRRGSYPLQPTG